MCLKFSTLVCWWSMLEINRAPLTSQPYLQILPLQQLLLHAQIACTCRLLGSANTQVSSRILSLICFPIFCHYVAGIVLDIYVLQEKLYARKKHVFRLLSVLKRNSWIHYERRQTNLMNSPKRTFAWRLWKVLA